MTASVEGSGAIAAIAPWARLAVAGPVRSSGCGTRSTVAGPTSRVVIPRAAIPRSVVSSSAAPGGRSTPGTGVVCRNAPTTWRPRSSWMPTSRPSPPPYNAGSSGVANGIAVIRMPGVEAMVRRSSSACPASWAPPSPAGISRIPYGPTTAYPPRIRAESDLERVVQEDPVGTERDRVFEHEGPGESERHLGLADEEYHGGSDGPDRCAAGAKGDLERIDARPGG